MGLSRTKNQTMSKTWVTLVAVIGGVFLIPPVTATAKPLCEYRSSRPATYVRPQHRTSQ